jgi:hypothetical protein
MKTLKEKKTSSQIIKSTYYLLSILRSIKPNSKSETSNITNIQIKRGMTEGEKEYHDVVI